MQSSGPAEELADDLAARACRWFIDHVHPRTGIVRDRAPNLDLARPASAQGSIASTGFYLSLLPELVRRKLIAHDEAIDRAQTSLKFVLRNVDHVGGVLLHFVDWESGKRWQRSEFSTLDTSIFLHGCIVARAAYPGVRDLADALVDRVDWTALWPAVARKPLLSYGFSGDDRSRLKASADVRSTENLMPCLLAAASRTHPLGRDCWYHMPIRCGPERRPGPAPHDAADLAARYDELRDRVLNPDHPLFTSQYGLVWANLRGLHDADGIDLWGNARSAALLNRAYCREIGAMRFRSYSADNGGWWGLSAGDAPGGYVARGPVDGDSDGVVWPTAALGSIAWIRDAFDLDLPKWASSAVWHRAMGRFGLAPFSVDRNWFGNDLIGIDVGCFACVYANSRESNLHRLWASHPVSRAGLARLEFSSN